MAHYIGGVYLAFKNLLPAWQTPSLEASVLTWPESRTLGSLSSLISVDSQLKQDVRGNLLIHLAIPH